MAVFTFFYGAQAYEFERPEIIAKLGAKVDIVAKIYTLTIKGVSGMTFTVKQNDTVPALEAQLLDADGVGINLEMSQVRFRAIERFGKKTIEKFATITDELTGKVQIDWQAGDTDIAGYYNCEFEITFTDSTILTVPNDGYFMISIIEELG